VAGERGVHGASLTVVRGVPHPTYSSRHEERVLIVCGRTLILCRTYRGLVSEENLRHSPRRIEKGTSNPRKLHVLPPIFSFVTESTIFIDERFIVVKIP
jgi:hypothetical protein